MFRCPAKKRAKQDEDDMKKRPLILSAIFLCFLLLPLGAGCFADGPDDDWSTQPGIGLKTGSGSGSSSKTTSDGYNPKPDLRESIKKDSTKAGDKTGSATKESQMAGKTTSNQDRKSGSASEKNSSSQSSFSSSGSSASAPPMHYYPAKYD